MSAQSSKPNGSERSTESRQLDFKLDPKVLADISQLTLKARIIADSALAGLHRSKQHGSSVEFAEHKEYSPGDDLRHLDWRAYARFDRDFVKRFEDETAVRSLLVIDNSGTMGYPAPPTERDSKLTYAKTLAATLAYVMARQGDAPGLATFSDKLKICIPSRARRGHLQEILGVLSTLEAQGPTHMESAFDTLSRGLARRSLIIIFSDLLDGGLEALSKVARLQARQHDVVLFHILDSDELDFPFEESTLFSSLESDQTLQVDAREIRSAFLEEMTKFRAKAEATCRRARMEYYLARTDQPAGEIVARFLAQRTKTRSSI